MNPPPSKFFPPLASSSVTIIPVNVLPARCIQGHAVAEKNESALRFEDEVGGNEECGLDVITVNFFPLKRVTRSS